MIRIEAKYKCISLAANVDDRGLTAEDARNSVEEYLEKCARIIYEEGSHRISNVLVYGTSHPEMYDSKD